VLIIDLSDVSMLSTTVALAIENLVKDARGAGCEVIIAGASGAVRSLLDKLAATGETGAPRTDSRLEALQQAIALLERKPAAPSAARA
jgi:SulP family sulfate permease